MVSIERIRESSVEQFLSTYETEPTHARHVTRLALLIFDQTQDILHNFDIKERNYLKYASLLHDTGYHIAPEKHHKHTYALIIQSKMQGFTQYDLEIIAIIARYHRGALPSKRHTNFEILSKEDKKLVKVLGSILRIADGLDRSHTDVVGGLKLVVDKDLFQCMFLLDSRSVNCASELFAAKKKSDLFEKVFSIECEFRTYQP